MEVGDDLFEVVSIDMRVDFGGGDAFVSQHFLNCPKVGSSFYQMRCKRVPEGMRAYVFMDSGFLC